MWMKSLSAPIVLMLALHASPAFGQTSAGAILGTVSDVSKALIPGVVITANNQGTNQTRQVISNETGNYRVEPLPAGVYTITAELPGFRKEARTDVKVDVDARVRLDFVLEVGAVTDTVEVTGSAPIVETDTSRVGQVVDQRKIEDLPLNGRNFSSLAYITPGAFAPRPGSHLGFRGGFVAVGLEEKTNQFLLDGINNNGGMTMELAAFPNVEAIAEFKIQTQNYGAEYGRYAGAQVDAITKSGTNEFHGSLFGFARLGSLDARSFFDPYPLSKADRSEFHRKQYGGVLGGPIIRNRLFFFVGFQGQRQLQNQRTAPTVPFPEYWSGDLSRLNKAIRDPLTGQPFPGNRIPANRISKIALGFKPLYPVPTRDSFVNNATAVIPIVQNYSQPNVKINYNFKDKHQLVGAWTFFDAPQNLEWDYAGRPELPGESIWGPVKNQALSLQHVWAVSSTFVNEFRTGLSRVNRDRRPELRARNYALELGIAGTASDYTPLAWGYPRVNITGYSFLGPGGSGPEPLRVDGNIMATNTISMQRGNHALKVGGDVFQQYATYTSIKSGGVFDFTGAVSGDAFADFLLGSPNVTQRTIPLGDMAAYARRRSSNWFVQDDWKARRNLTLNIGLRYELQYPFDELKGRLAAFDPSLGSGRGGIRIKGKANGHPYQKAIDTFKSYYPGLVIGYSDRFHKIDKNNFAPRLGLAWTPRGGTGTVVRASYGMFYTMNSLNQGTSIWSAGPFFQLERFTRANSPTWENPFPGRGLSGTVNVVGTDYNMVSAYYGHWNVGIQHELPGGVALDLSYVGKKGTKIDATRDINQPLGGARPYPLFGPIAYAEPRGSSIYHGLQARIERRSATGLTVLTSYAWGKLISDDGRGATAQDAYNLHAERGLGQEDMRHRLTTSFIYSLPLGRGRRYLNVGSTVADAVVGGWELSGIVRANSGNSLTPTISQNISGSGRPGNDRPNLTGDPKVDHPSPRTGWWNRAAFSMPAPNTFGSAGAGILIGPGYSATDLSLLKRFKVREKKDLQFRWEVFNLLNQTNFWDTKTTFDSATFGAISSAQPSRQMQVGLKFIF